MRHANLLVASEAKLFWNHMQANAPKPCWQPGCHLRDESAIISNLRHIIQTKSGIVSLFSLRNAWHHMERN